MSGNFAPQDRTAELPKYDGAFELIDAQTAHDTFAGMSQFEFTPNTAVAKLSGEKRPVSVDFSADELEANDYYYAISGRYADAEQPITVFHINPILGQAAEMGRAVTFGRSKEADFPFTDSLVSREHAQLSAGDQGGTLSSASSNESYLFIVPKNNGEEVAEVSVETIPRAELKRELGEEAVQAEVGLVQTPEQPTEPELMEFKAELQEKFDAIAADIVKVEVSLRKDIELSDELFVSAQNQLVAVREYLAIISQSDVREKLSGENERVLLGVQRRLVQDLRSLYTQSDKAEMDRTSFDAIARASDKASEINTDEQIDDESKILARNVVSTLDAVAQAKIVATRGYNINDASGNLIAKSGQFLGRIHNLESLTGYDTIMDLQDRLGAVARDLEAYAEMLKLTQRPAQNLIGELQQVRSELGNRS